MTDVEKYLAMKGFQQHLKLIRSNPNNQQSGQGGGGYRPQPTGQTSLPRPQASQVSCIVLFLSLSLSLSLSSFCTMSCTVNLEIFVVKVHIFL